MPTQSNLRLVKPAAQKRAVGAVRRPNIELRSREHLTETEVEKLIKAANGNRHSHRDATMVLVAYRHGLRASEICELRWDQIDFTSATLHVHRVKNGKPSTHPVRGDELRALRKLQREAPKSPFVFVTERGGPFSTDSFNWMVKRAGRKAHFPFQVHAHMLRHATGYRLAGDELFRTISGTRISSIRCATPSYHRRASRISGRTDASAFDANRFGV